MDDNLPKYKELEIFLNQFTFRGGELGSLLSKYHTLRYLNKTESRKKGTYLLLFAKFLVKGLIQTKPKHYKGKILLINKLDNRPHLNAMIDPIYKHYSDISLLYATEAKCRSLPYAFTKHLNVKILFNITQYLYQNLGKILNVYKDIGLPVSKAGLVYTLIIQLTAYCNWVTYFENSTIKLLLTDFDRDERTAPMIIAARKQNIKSITLVHGILNPPFGYIPVLASEIWCWGNFQRKQLLTYGINPAKIQIVGNPIATKYLKSLNNIDDDARTRIGIGLNPISIEDNKFFLNTFRQNSLFSRIDWIIKLHPSMKIIDWMNSMKADNFIFYESKDLPVQNFFEKIDLLIVSNSGIGYEAVINDIPIWVYRVSEGQDGHDGIMIERGGCPEINNTDILSEEIMALINHKEIYIKNLLQIEQAFVYNEFYAAVGNEASKNIILKTEKLLNNG